MYLQRLAQKTGTKDKDWHKRQCMCLQRLAQKITKTGTEDYKDTKDWHKRHVCK